MKKILLFLTMIVFTLTSCSTDEQIDSPKTTSVNFAVSQPSSTTTSRTTIDRNSIPLYVDNLTINAASRPLTPYVATETFDFTGAYNSALVPALKLNNVALGQNTFSATSTSATINEVFGLVSSNSSTLDALRAKTPYIPCFSVNNPTPEIVYGTNPVVNLTMETNHGRILTLFTISSNANKYVVVIEATTTSGGTTTTKQRVEIRPETVNRTATFEWSNELAVDGARVNYTIKICEAVSNTVLKTITKELIVQKGKSLSCVYTINENDVRENITSGGIRLTFPTIVEVDCAEVFSNGGFNCYDYDDDGKYRAGQNAFDECGYHKIVRDLYKRKFDLTPNNTTRCQ